MIPAGTRDVEHQRNSDNATAKRETPFALPKVDDNQRG